MGVVTRHVQDFGNRLSYRMDTALSGSYQLIKGYVIWCDPGVSFSINKYAKKRLDVLESPEMRKSCILVFVKLNIAMRNLYAW
jgi:hypothetical protein